MGTYRYYWIGDLEDEAYFESSWKALNNEGGYEVCRLFQPV